MVEENFTSRDAAREKKLKELLFEEEIKGENRVQRALFIVIILSGCLAVFFAFDSQPFERNIPNFIVVFALVCYHLTIRLILKRKKYKPFIKYLTIFIPITLTILAMTSYGINRGLWIQGVKSDVVVLMFAVIGVSGIYHSRGLPIFAGTVAAVEYSIMFGYGVFFGDLAFELGAERYDIPIVTTENLILVCLSLLLLGFVVSFLAKQLPVLLRRSLDSEAEFDYLEQVNRAIEENHRQKTNFFVNVAHESKTPLTLIQNYLGQYIEEKGSDEDLVIVKDNVDKLLRDMVNFMDIEKLEKGNLVYDHTRITPVSGLLETVIPLFKDLAESKKIVFFDHIQGDIYMKADESALDRIVNNLLSNAIRYTPEGGEISVSLVRQGECFSFSVVDTGMGIPDDQIDHIFTPYYQLAQKKRNIQGIGMGLAIVKQIVDSLGGEISVESEVDRGSCFTVTLPHCKNCSEDLLPGSNSGGKWSSANTYSGVTGSFSPPPADVLPETSEGTILVVEDNRDLLRYITGILGKHCRVYVAENGRFALERLEKIPKPDLIISDIMMDEMDGREFYLILTKKEEFRDIPFIFLTAKTAIEDEIVALSQGAVDFIHKPFNTEVLLAKIYSIIKNRNLKQILFERDKFASLGMLVGGISHEIFNPLKGIIDPLAELEDILDKSELKNNEKTAKYLNKIETNTKRITDLVNNLQQVYHNGSIETRDIPVKEICESVCRFFENAISYDVVFELQLDPSFRMKGNPQAFEQILTNLISNAIDAVKENKGREKSVLIKALVSGKDKKLIIADTGCGIPEQHLNDIFNAFFTRKEVGTGTGLGLFIVKDLILKMGWHIDVRSEVGKGTQFVISSK